MSLGCPTENRRLLIIGRRDVAKFFGGKKLLLLLIIIFESTVFRVDTRDEFHSLLRLFNLKVDKVLRKLVSIYKYSVRKNEILYYL